MSHFSPNSVGGEPALPIPLGWNDPPASLMSANGGDQSHAVQRSIFQQRRHHRPVDPSVQVEVPYHHHGGGATAGAYYSPAAGAAYIASPQRPASAHPAPTAYQQVQHLPPPQQLVTPQFTAPASQQSTPNGPYYQQQPFQQHPLQPIQQPLPQAGGGMVQQQPYPQVTQQLSPPISTAFPQQQQQTQGYQQLNPHPASAFSVPQLQQQEVFGNEGQWQQRRPAQQEPPQQTQPDTANLIFNPPNSVCLEHTRSPTQLNPQTYIPPRKAAGDVSLSGSQLVAFLGPVQEGIQLRIRQLQIAHNAGQISDACLKKLNFVIDSIDRCLYDEANQFFEQMFDNFPLEMSSSWAHGVRLLIGELKKAGNAVPMPQLPMQPVQVAAARVGSAEAPTQR